MARDPQRRIMNLSLAASLLMLVGKMTAFVVTNSTAILSDAAESVVHGVATGLAAFSLWYAARPADPGHPYGHGRIAYFSAGFEGALVFAAAIAIISSAVMALIHGPRLHNLMTGLLISVALAAINLALGLALVAVGKKHNTLILIANGKHVLSDVWTTLAAILGVGLVMVTGAPWLDPLAGLLIGAYVLISGYRLLRHAFGGLMDEIDSRLVEAIHAELQGARERRRITYYHQLRCRTLNDEVWIEVHMLVPRELSVQEAHGRVTQVEEAIRQRLEPDKVRITTHIEPDDHRAAHPEGHAELDPLGRHGESR